MDIVIIGTGGMAKEIWGLCRRLERNVIGFVAERADYVDQLMGRPILGTDSQFLLERQHMSCALANGTPRIRQKIAEKYAQSTHMFPNLIHPLAEFLGVLKGLHKIEGVTIMPGGVIQPDVTISDFVHINMGVTIGHDVTIGRYSVINHNAGISGNVTIGEACLIGAGATIIEGNTIGDGATVGAGAVVTKHVPAGEVWVGVPAQPIDGRDKRPTYAELYQVQ